MIILKVLIFFVLYLILFLIGLFFVLIISPIKGYGSFDVKSVYFKGSYLFGIIKVTYLKKYITIRLLGFKVYRGKGTDSEDEDTLEEKNIKESNKKEKKEKEKKNHGIPNRRVIVLSLNLVKKLIKTIAPKEASLSLTLGFDDPYYTGLTALITQIVFIPLNIPKKYHFNFRPVYDDLAINYEGHAKINFAIIQLIMPCLIFIIKKPIRDYLGWFKFKKKKKDV